MPWRDPVAGLTQFNFLNVTVGTISAFQEVRHAFGTL